MAGRRMFRACARAWRALVRMFTDNNILHVYTCGTYIDRDNVADIGYGVWFGDRFVQSVGRPALAVNEGLAVNHRAELFAVLTAMIVLRYREERFVRIYVDSRYVKVMLEKFCFGSLGNLLPDGLKNADVLRLIGALRDPDKQVALFHMPFHEQLAFSGRPARQSKPQLAFEELVRFVR